MAWWQTTLVALGSAVVGGLLTGVASWLIFKRQERSGLAREVRMALGDYFGALVVAVADLTRMPENAPDLDLAGWLIDSGSPPHGPVRRWFRAMRWVSTEKRMRKVFGPEPFAKAERVVLAHARLQILALPPSLDRALVTSLDYVSELGAKRTPVVKARWPEVRGALLDAVREHIVDAGELARALRLPLETVGETAEGAAHAETAQPV